MWTQTAGAAPREDDGCIDYYRYFEKPMGEDPQNDAEESDMLHICDIDEEIARLQALKRVARTWFSERRVLSGWEQGDS